MRRNCVPQRAKFEQCYLEGVAKGLGVEIAARCVSQEDTFATIFIPEDAIDAQYHMDGSRAEDVLPHIPYVWFIGVERPPMVGA